MNANRNRRLGRYCIVIAFAIPACAFAQFPERDGRTAEEFTKSKLETLDLGETVEGLRFNAETSQLAAWTSYEIAVFDLASNKAVLKVRNEEYEILDAACDAKGAWRVIGVHEGVFRLTNLSDKNHREPWRAEFLQPDHAAFSLDGSQVLLVGSVTRSDDRVGATHIRLISAVTSESIAETVFSRTGASAAALHPCKPLAAVAWGKRLTVTDLKSGCTLGKAAMQRATIRKLVFAPTGDVLALLLGKGRWYGGDTALKHLFWHSDAYQDLRVHIVDWQTGRELSTLGGNSYPVSSLAFLPDSQTALTTGGQPPNRKWDVQTGNVLPNSDEFGGDFDQHITCSRDGRMFAVADNQNTIWLLRRTPPAKATDRRRD